jgi:hypothetical protein
MRYTISSIRTLTVALIGQLQDYGFDYSDNDEDADESGSVDLENMYYVAKCKLLGFLSMHPPHRL